MGSRLSVYNTPKILGTIKHHSSYQEAGDHSLKEKQWSTDANIERNQMSKLPDKGYRAAITETFLQPLWTHSTQMKKTENLSKEVEDIK